MIVLLIFAVVASWRFTPPPRALAAAAAQPATAAPIHTDKAMAFIQVMPGRAGNVEVSINVLTGEFERLDAKEVTLVLSKPESGIEPFRRPAVRRDEADWRIDQMTIPLPGIWRVRVDILINDFEKVVSKAGQHRAVTRVGGELTTVLPLSLSGQSHSSVTRAAAERATALRLDDKTGRSFSRKLCLALCSFRVQFRSWFGLCFWLW